MAHTATTLTQDQANERFRILAIHAENLKAAISAFEQVYDCDTVGLSEWAESIDEVMCEIECDINETYGE